MVLLGFLFCLSGIPALIYQVSWQRILALHSGVGVYSVAMIVAAFLAGLGLGSYIGGLLSAHVASKRALKMFAMLEMGIGLFALVSCRFYYDLLSAHAALFYDGFLAAGIMHFVVLLPPTVLMGMSLPFLVRASVKDPPSACRTIGYLYGINTLGAAFGAFITPWILIRYVGMGGAVLAGAGLNMIVGAGALAFGRFVNPLDMDDRSLPEPPVQGRADIEYGGKRPLFLWILLYSLSGFCAIGFEILWFRIIDVAVKSTAFTYGTVLSVFLGGLALGSLVGGPVGMKLKRPLHTFLICQSLLVLFAGVTIALLATLPPDFFAYRHLMAYWRWAEEGFPLGWYWSWEYFLLLYVALPVFLYGLPTVLMGFSFTVLQRAVHDERRTSGQKVGMLQAGNIAGCTAGSLIVGLVGLNLLGTTGCVQGLVFLGLAFAVIGIYFYGARSTFTILSVLMALFMIVMPDHRSFWSRLHGDPRGTAMFAEDSSGLVAIIRSRSMYKLTVDGKSHSWLPYGGVHSVLGAMPAAIHPNPRDVAIVGLGSGDTAWAASFRAGTERVVVFELRSGEKKLLTEFAKDRPDSKLRAFLGDPRISIREADGRIALARNDDRYDLIEADAMRPTSAYSGNISSVEFFRLCSKRLKPGGLMCQWAPTRRVQQSFTAVFRHVVDFDSILVGSNEPIVIDRPTWIGRLSDPAAVTYLGREVTFAVSYLMHRSKRVGRHTEPAAGLNYDLFPRDEFGSPSASPDWVKRISTMAKGAWDGMLTGLTPARAADDIEPGLIDREPDSAR